MGKGSGGGGQPTQTSSTVTNTNVPEYARPYVENMLGATQKQLFNMKGNEITGFQPYKAYGGTYDAQGKQTGYDPSKAIAGFSPLQLQAQQNAANLQTGPEAFNSQVGSYMSPYMQNVTDIQKREAARQSGIMGTQDAARATQAGAFGGSRDAIMGAERERNLGQQMNDIQAKGLQDAYTQATNQYNQGFTQNLQAGQAQNALGLQQQQQQQQAINQSMQDYANAQQYPLMQLGTMSNMLRGLPMQAQNTQQYQAQANPITQGISTIGSGASIYNALNSTPTPKAEGGAVRSMASGGITSIPRYDVGGAVMSELAKKPDGELEKEARESPSAQIREMAAAILKQRQAGMQAGPQYAEASQEGPGIVSAAGGGIIAFAGGQTVPPTPLPPLTPEQEKAMDAGVMKAVANGGSGIQKLNATVPLSASQDMGIKQAGAAIDRNLTPSLAADAPAQAATAPTQTAVTDQSAAPAQAPSPGIVDAGRAAIADMKAKMTPVAAEAGMTQKAMYEKDLADKKALGLDNTEAQQKYMQDLMAQKANLAAEANRDNWMRRAQFFADMGTIPGPTLVAGLTALKKTIPDVLQDAKDQKLARQQADKAIYDLGESMRLEKLGLWDKADTRRQAAIKTMADMQSHMTTASVAQAGHEMSLQGQQAQAAATVTSAKEHRLGTENHATIMANSAKAVANIKDATDRLQVLEMAKTRLFNATTAADTKAYQMYSAASDHLSHAIRGAEAMKSSKGYLGAIEIVSMAEANARGADGKIDTSKIPAALKPSYEQALRTISTTDQNATDAIDTARAAVEATFGRLKGPGAGSAPTTGGTGNIQSKVEAGGQKYEPDKYIYKITEDGSVQRKLKGK